jgi:drug/metabolite transporter (DMT)-like permease
MERWIQFSLLFPVLYATTNFVDKALLSGINARIMPIYTATVGLMAGVVFFVLTGFPIIPLKDVIIIMATGVLNTLSLIVYFKALNSCETSKVNILFEIIPLFVLILGYLFLGETITLIQFIGFVMVLSAVLGVAYFEEKKTECGNEENSDKLSKTMVIVYIMIFNMMFAIAGVLAKFVMNETSFSAVLSYESFGIGLGGLIILIFSKKIRKEFLESKISWKQKSYVGLNETIYVLAKTCTFYAFSLGPVALVSVIGSIQPFIAVAMGWLLTILNPKIFKENISKKSLTVKFIAALVIIFGIYLIQS